jgi:hypothetical protein
VDLPGQVGWGFFIFAGFFRVTEPPSRDLKRLINYSFRSARLRVDSLVAALKKREGGRLSTIEFKNNFFK